ncbi:kelch repeat-containing protein [Mucilaginibacter sp. PAMB04168]|uniref:Kelch repeat-containing protein n=1 Tax=Mucilaginibacter sp. PAMB04168 TaxID=3138567 RepID=UPI0031F65B88
MKRAYRSLTCMVLVLMLVRFGAHAQSTPGGAALNFTDFADMPERVIYSSYANDGQYLYSLNGMLYNKRISPKALRFDPATKKWRQITDKLIPKINAASVYVPSVHKIYIMGGMKVFSNGLFFNVETLDTQTGEVSILKTENPNPQINCALAVWDNKIYLFGGSDNGYGSSRLYEFDVATEKFKRLKDMPFTAQTAGTVIDGVLYTFGGYNPYNKFIFDEVYAYDIKTDTWKRAGKLPNRVSATGIASTGKNVYVIGSYGDPDFIGYYNTDSGQFIKLKSNMAGRRFASSGIVGHKLWVYGGSSSVIDPGVIKVQAADIQ